MSQVWQARTLPLPRRSGERWSAKPTGVGVVLLTQLPDRELGEDACRQLRRGEHPLHFACGSTTHSGVSTVQAPLSSFITLVACIGEWVLPLPKT